MPPTTPRKPGRSNKIVTRPPSRTFPPIREGGSGGGRTPPNRNVGFALRDDFLRQVKDGPLKAIVGRPPALDAHATNMMDGRRVPMVLAVLRDAHGEPIPNVPIQLTKGHDLLDRARTDKHGVALLLFPAPMPASASAASHGGGHASRGSSGGSKDNTKMELPSPSGTRGTVEAIHKARSVSKDVTIPEGKQHALVELVLDVTHVPVHSGANGGAIDTHATPTLPAGDDPLSRLPADFTTDLCRDITRLMGPSEDPIMGLVPDADFRKKRTPTIRRMMVPMLGEVRFDSAGKPLNDPNRYLVRVRQEWIFLGYTLGELQNLNPLDPGSILRETSERVGDAIDSATHALDRMDLHSFARTDAGLRSHAHVEDILRVANSVETSAIAGGIGFGIGPIVGGIGGGKANVTTTTNARNTLDATLQVNSWLQAAASISNQRILSTSSARRELQETLQKTLGQVSPLLSRVTNLVHWTLYQNYMVCTHVEDVVEVDPVPVIDLSTSTVPEFTDEDIVELRRILSPALLEPTLRRRFDHLAAAVDAKRGAALPVTRAFVEVEYAAVLGSGNLSVSLVDNGGATVAGATLALRQNSTRAWATMELDVPTPAADISSLGLTLSLGERTSFAGVLFPASVSVPKVRVTFETAHGYRRTETFRLGAPLQVDQDHTTRSDTEGVTIPPPSIFTEDDPLVVHVNKNKAYYFGALCEAALVQPALRDDCRFFQNAPGGHALWKLPIVGFEGTTALVLREPDTTIPQVAADVRKLLADAGSATLIQIAAPGAYGEALQGLLSLDIVPQLLHPALQQPVEKVVPVALVNTNGVPITPLPTNGGTAPGVPTTPGTGVPTVPLPSP